MEDLKELERKKHEAWMAYKTSTLYGPDTERLWDAFVKALNEWRKATGKPTEMWKGRI